MVRVVLILAAAALFVMLAGGCLVMGGKEISQSGTRVTGATLNQIEPGVTTREWLLTAIGEPTSRAPVPNEAGNGLSNRRGTVAAARDRGVSDSATAQFFINLADNPHFDRQDGDSAYTAGYAVFGRVLQGLEVLDRIAALPTSAQGPFPGWCRSRRC